jgi:hypothetical protein
VRQTRVNRRLTFGGFFDVLPRLSVNRVKTALQTPPIPDENAVTKALDIFATKR